MTASVGPAAGRGDRDQAATGKGLKALFVAIAYLELNKADPDCGTTFTWAARAFGPTGSARLIPGIPSAGNARTDLDELDGGMCHER
jgi:hypothetical protein